MTYRKSIQQKAFWLVIFNIIIWIVCSVNLGTSLVGKLPTVFKVTFTTFTLCGLIMFLIHEARLLSDEYSVLKRISNFFLYYALIGGGSIFLLLWLEMGYFGFFPIFIWTAIIFAWICFLVLVALDLKPIKGTFGMKGMVNMMFFYLFLCAGYMTMGFSLPQYDPQYEIKKLKGDRGDLSKASKETLIKVGSDIFKDFECFNCHNVSPGGIKKRGPNLAITDLGGPQNLFTSITDPQKTISKGFDKPKIRNAMPDYYGTQIKPLELKALIEFLMSLKAEASVGSEKMPDGWWTDPKRIEEGRKVFEGLANPDVKCAACHGSEGIPLLEGARDFINDKEYLNSKTDAQLFYSVTNGVLDAEGDETPMSAWGDMLSPAQRWEALAYIFKTFTRERPGVDYGATATEKKEKKIWRPWPWG